MARIQTAARDVLVESGAAGLNTNLIAQRAGVNIATLYRYYPDKYAILLHLFEQFESQRRHYVLERIGELSAGARWRPWIGSIIDDLARMRESDPSGVALRMAMASSPELLSVDRSSSDQIAASLGEAVSAAFPQLAPARARAIADLTVGVITVGLDSAFSVTPPDRLRVTELKTMIGAYLAVHLEPR